MIPVNLHPALPALGGRASSRAAWLPILKGLNSLGIDAVVQPLQGWLCGILFPWVTPTAIHVAPFQGTRKSDYCRALGRPRRQGRERDQIAFRTPYSIFDLALDEQLPDLDPADIYAEGDGENVGESYSDPLRALGGPPEIAHVGSGNRDSSAESATRIQPRATPWEQGVPRNCKP